MAIHKSDSNAESKLIFNFTGNGASSNDINVPNNTTPTPSPVVPNTSGANTTGTTNVTTPDTGFFTGSSSLGAAPAIIFFSVIIAVIAILFYKFKTSPHAYHSFSFSKVHLNILDTKTSLKRIGIFSGALVTLFLAALVIVPAFVDAEKPHSSALGSAIQFSVSSTISATTNLSSSASYATTKLTLNIGSSNYSLFISTNDDSASGNYMKSTNGKDYLAPSAGTVASPHALGTNEWGIAYGANADATKAKSPVFVGVPTYSTNPLQLPAATGSTYPILFAARGDSSHTVAGAYSTTILFTAISNLSSSSDIEEEIQNATKNTTEENTTDNTTKNTTKEKEETPENVTDTPEDSPVEATPTKQN